MGVLFSQEEEELTPPRHEELLIWAAEIVARQREEQQRERRSHSSSGSSSRIAQRAQYFASLTDLIKELLDEGQINVDAMSRHYGVNDISVQSEDDESEDGEYLIGLRGRNVFEPQSSTSESHSDEERDRPSDRSNASARTMGLAATSRNTDARLVKSREHLLAEIELHSGAFSGTVGIERTLGMREMGIRYVCGRPSGRIISSRHLSDGALYPFQCASAYNSFFPNRRKVVEKVRSKTFCCQYLPDGNGLLAASQDEVIRLYEREGYRQRYKLSNCFQTPYVGWSILDLVVSPDTRYCVYCTWSEKLYQCKLDADIGEDDRWTTLHQNHGDDFGRFALFSLRFNYDGTEIVSAGSDGRLYVYDCNSASNVLSIPAHEDDVNAVSFGDTSRHLIFSAGDDGLCKVWDRRALSEDHRPVGVFAGHRDGITYVDSKGDDRYLLTNSKDQSIKIWDIRRFSSASAQDETRRAVCQQKWDYRYQTVPRYSNCSTPLKGDGSVLTLRGHSVLHTLIRAHFSPVRTGQRYVYTGCARGQCVVYDILSGEIVHYLDGHRSVVRDCAWHPFDNEIITASWDGVTAMWRYDERMEKNINPESWDEQPGDEETSDEYYALVQPRRYNVKRRTAKRQNKDAKIARKQPTSSIG